MHTAPKHKYIILLLMLTLLDHFLIDIAFESLKVKETICGEQVLYECMVTSIDGHGQGDVLGFVFQGQVY
jgi:hypothetical protein